MPDDIFKKLPKFGKLNFGTAKVHLCQLICHLPTLGRLDVHIQVGNADK